MSTLKCKMCGGTIEFETGTTVLTCEYCNTKQTLPRLDDDRKANLYDRANHFRRNNEYDKAMSIYEQILNEDNTDSESYWSLVLCKYGIEYVEDPATHKRVPTVNRAQFTSVLADEDYKKALEYADTEQRIVYEDEARTIDEIQKGILEISSKEDPFDVFICYKETDNNGRRTQDSVLATDLYHQLTQEGFKVFFSRITLEDKLGTAYEPYIFAALNSAKVMVVLGTKPEFFNAVWVKNEWSRYLALVKQSNGKKILIPAYRDMDPYDLPDEFSHLQAQDMGKLGFMQDLIRGIKKIVKADEPKPVVKETVVVGGNPNSAPLIKRAFICLEDGEWDKADDLCEQVLNQDPENAQAYLGKLMAELHVRNQDDLKDYETPFDDNKNYRNALRFGDEELASTLKSYVDYINERNENKRLTDIYNNALTLMKAAKAEEEYKAASKAFKSISGFKDSDELAQSCLDKAEDCRKDTIYKSARAKMNGNRSDEYTVAITLFQSISGWKDSDKQIEVCQRTIDDINAKEEARRLENARKAKKFKKTVAIVAPIVIACVVLAVVYINVIQPKMKYNKAMSLIDSGDYATAYSMLTELGYNDVIINNKNERAQALLANGEYDSAYALFSELGNNDAIVTSKNDRALDLLASGDYEAARALFEETGNEDGITSCQYEEAMVLVNEGDYENGYALLESIGHYEDIEASEYSRAVALVNSGEYIEAHDILITLDSEESVELLNSISSQYNEELLSNPQVGSFVYFGSYEQDNDLSNGPEPIEWRVVDVDGDRALLLSLYALDVQPYNSRYVTWADSSLRQWLNDDFYNSAFSQYEQNLIQLTDLTTEELVDRDDFYYDDRYSDRESTYSYYDTQDKVFVLSYSEMQDYFDGVSVCRVSDYIYAQDLIRMNGFSCYWWLRSSGNYVTHSYFSDGYEYTDEYRGAQVVSTDGHSGDGFYFEPEDSLQGVRPAIWIEIE